MEILRGDADQWIRRSDQEIAASGWPSLAVSKAEFGDEWPFRDDRVTVECRDGLFYIVHIGGYDFALNGAARSRFGLPFEHDAGVAVLGKSVGPFIDMAHGLSARPRGKLVSNWTRLQASTASHTNREPGAMSRLISTFVGPLNP